MYVWRVNGDREPQAVSSSAATEAVHLRTNAVRVATGRSPLLAPTSLLLVNANFVRVRISLTQIHPRGKLGAEKTRLWRTATSGRRAQTQVRGKVVITGGSVLSHPEREAMLQHVT